MLSSSAARGVIFVIIGPGGAGKNAIMKAIIKRCADITQLATATTRAMRAGEAQGREHLFLSFERFREMIDRDELLEYQEVTPNKFYGIPRQNLADCISDGEVRIADIEVLGASKLAAAYPENVVQIFVTVPGESIDEQLAVLASRMQQRDDGTTDISERLQRARRLELPYQCECDHIVINDTLEHAIENTSRIIRAELNKRQLTALDLPAHHLSLAARLADDDIPLEYGDPAGEYAAAITGAILLDRSHEGRILLEGESRFDLINRMSTNDLLGILPSEGRASIFTNANARILFRAVCFNLPQGLLLISEAGQGAALVAYLRRNIFFGDKVIVRDLAAESAQFAIHGATADIVMGNLQADLSGLPPMHAANVDFAQSPLTVARRKSIAGDHWLVICPAVQAVALHRHLLSIGESAGLRAAGSLTYNLLRVRSGRPAGLELSPDYIPLEVGLWDEISLDKGCYTGQEIIARMESRQRLAKTLVKIDLSVFVSAPAPVFADGKLSGRLTSSAKAPDGQIFALAVIKRDYARPGTALLVGDDRLPAQVSDYAGVQPSFLLEQQ